ncbi:type I restriction modification protein [Phocicoccus schoeneichii]|uniref:Type I restriction modification DNA specificity domain-containing protein n=1 Tax=Phocicoccus schoeneichii TaxID=1812261 RepID=A0A6V7RLX4_9BACL|nr:restriction endonuclease subunit S [Jeotgalicoccus schoeneichii]GGH55833.1 type I restriction modification protein [Jeotgalicoccus schoeneichii]CAD2079341.1 hypothetical protein JEOSCH030_01612 [Jeotgalicoccus schoeneichii]
MRFEDYKLGEISTFKYGKMPKKDRIKVKGYPIYTGYKVSGYYDEYMYETEQLIVVARGVGGTGDVKLAPEKSYITNLSIIVELDKKKADKTYMMYYLNSLKLRYLDTGSAQSQITIKDLTNLKVRIPCLKEQKKVAQTLNKLFEKIELNNSIIANLEELAQTLFKHWFVDFEFPNEEGKPYKSSGGKMVESELGMIPEGWDVKTLKDLIEIIDNRGKTPPLVNYSEYPIIDVKALSGDSRVINYGMCTKYVNKNTYDNWFRKGHPQRYDILFSTVGSIASMKMFFEGNFGTIAQNVVALRSIAINPFYLYQYLIYQQEEIKQLNIGSVQPSIKVTHFIKKKILVPNKELYNKFNNTISILSLYINSINKENVKLMNVRDTLLPKLLSGEIELPDDMEVTDDVPIS